MANEPLVDDVQRIVDQLAERLQQSVAIDDPQGNVIAMSKHYGDEDLYRIKLMLNRRILPEYHQFFDPYVNGLVAGRLASPVRTPPEPALGLRGRIGYPVTTTGGVIAILWLIDTGPELLGADARLIEESCTVLGEVLGRRDALKWASQTELTGETLLNVLGGREAVDGELQRLAYFDQSNYIVVVFWTDEEEGRIPGAREVFERIARQLGGSLDLSVTGVEDGLDVAILSATGMPPENRDVVVRRLANLTRKAVEDLEPGFGAGISGPLPLLDLRRLYTEAALSAFLARHLFLQNKVAEASSIRPLISLLCTPATVNGGARLEALQTMLQEPGGFAHATIGALVDSQGSSSEWAKRLHVHRTTLHYRVSQIEERTGLDIRAPADMFLAFATWLRVTAEHGPIGDLVKECRAQHVKMDTPQLEGDGARSALD